MSGYPHTGMGQDLVNELILWGINTHKPAIFRVLGAPTVGFLDIAIFFYLWHLMIYCLIYMIYIFFFGAI